VSPVTTETRTEPRLRVRQLTKSFLGTQVLHAVSFDACDGRVLGVVGENGSGKSTTMNVLTGVLLRDGGEVLLDGKPFTPSSRRESDAAGIAFIQQELNIFPNLSVAENIFLAHAPRRFSALPFIARRQMHERALVLLERVDLDVPPDMPAGSLSSGERQLLEIARGLSIEARVLILDEPTSSLASVEAERLFAIVRRLKESGVAILFISHDLEKVLEVCDDILVMRDGRVTLTGAAAALKVDDLVLAMVGRSIESQFPARAAPEGQASPVPLLQVIALSGPGMLRNIYLQVAQGEIVGIGGLMGSGRTELARALFGLDPYAEGEVRLGGQCLPSGDVASRLKGGAAFLTEDRRQQGVLPDASVSDNIALAALKQYASASPWGVLHGAALEAAIQSVADQVRLKSGDVRATPVSTLSGGNQQKVVLGRWLLCRPKLFILDEPTRGIDISAKQDIYRLLIQMSQAGIGILLISSELEELTGLCDRILVMRRGELTNSFDRSHFDREAILRAAFGQGSAA
jgi:ribose transport system ATP-binding protein